MGLIFEDVVDIFNYATNKNIKKINEDGSYE